MELAAGITQRISGKAAADAVRVYRERTFAGRELYAAVPAGEESVGLVQASNACLAEAWRSLPDGIRVSFHHPDDQQAMLDSAANYFVVIPRRLDTGDSPYPGLMANPAFETVASRHYRQLARVPEQPWYLIRKQ